MPLLNATPAQLRAYGDALTKDPAWGPAPPAWHVAMAQLDWYVEAKLREEEEQRSEYEKFLEAKRHEGADCGFEPTFMPDFLFDFQRHLAEWSIRGGRRAVFADCGLGKTAIELVWAQNILEKTGKPAMILAPLAVSQQIVREGAKFGIECARSSDGAIPCGITLSNYERIDKFDPAKFGGVVCDESSILKSFDGKRKHQITEFMLKVPYRLLATATAAPNDYIELGTSSEALGYLGYMDMLGRFFRNDNNNSAARRMYGEVPKWRLKGHAETPFWRWVTSWARACRKPSDLGFNGDRFELPELIENTHVIKASRPPDGMLFDIPATDLRSQREDRKRTIQERCEKVAELVDHDQPALVWCHLNDEGNMLADIIPDAVQVAGSDRDEAKEERLAAFANGEARVLISKPKIAAWGLNFQHCAHVTYFPSHSFESYYQAVRRCWRFGQERPVVVDIVMTEGERAIMDNQQRKAEAAGKMFESLVREMNHSLAVQGFQGFKNKEEIPTWL